MTTTTTVVPSPDQLRVLTADEASQLAVLQQLADGLAAQDLTTVRSHPIHRNMTIQELAAGYGSVARFHVVFIRSVPTSAGIAVTAGFFGEIPSKNRIDVYCQVWTIGAHQSVVDRQQGNQNTRVPTDASMSELLDRVRGC